MKGDFMRIIQVLVFCLFLATLCFADDKIVPEGALEITGKQEHPSLMIDSNSKIWRVNELAFCDDKGNRVGTLYLESPLRFEGNADASAKAFFNHLLKKRECPKDCGKECQCASH